MAEKEEFSFNDGVVSDVEEMKLQNTMLSWGLNLSFISGQGKNFILTTLKGNENVNGLKLTAGFYPVGACEYNTICYLFSVNPTTAESEIGSIGSPDYTGGSGLITMDYRPLQNLIPLGGGPAGPMTTPKFNFQLGFPLKIEAKIAYDGSVNFYFVDNNNINRVVNSGFIRNPDNTFTLGVIAPIQEGYLDSTTQLIPNSEKIMEVDLVGVENQGALAPGNYIYYFFYVTAGGNQTALIGQSFIVTVYDGDNIIAKMNGGRIDTSNNVQLTNKSVHLKLQNLDQTFKFIRVFYERIDGEDESQRSYFQLVNDVPINAPTLDFFHLGTEKLATITAGDINTQFGNIGPAAGIAQANNKLYIANNVPSNAVDSSAFETFASKIKAQWFFEYMSILGAQNLDELYSTAVSQANGGYANPNNVYYNLGYWGGEAYEFGIQFKLPDGTTLAYPIAGFDYFNGDATPVSTIGTNGKPTGIMRFPVRNSNAVPDLLNDGQVCVLGCKMNLQDAFNDASWTEVQSLSIGFQFVRSLRNKQCVAQGYLLRGYRFLGQNGQFNGNGWANWVKDHAIDVNMKGYRSTGPDTEEVLFDSSANAWRTVNFPLMQPSVEFTGTWVTQPSTCGNIKNQDLEPAQDGNALGDDLWNYNAQYKVDSGDNPDQCQRSWVLTTTYTQYGYPSGNVNLAVGLGYVDNVRVRRYTLEVDNLNYAFFSNDYSMDRELIQNVLNETAVYVNPISHVKVAPLAENSGIDNTTVSIVFNPDPANPGTYLSVYFPDQNITIAIAGFTGPTTEANYGTYFILNAGQSAIAGLSTNLDGKRFYTTGEVTDGNQADPATNYFYPISTAVAPNSPTKLFLTTAVYKANANGSKAAPRYTNTLSSSDPECIYEGSSYAIIDGSDAPHPQTRFASLLGGQSFNYGRRSFTNTFRNQYQDYFARVDDLNSDAFIGINFGSPDLSDTNINKLVTGTVDPSGNPQLSNDPWVLLNKLNLENPAAAENPASNVNRNYMYSDINKISALVNVYEKARYVPFIGKGSSGQQTTSKQKLLALYNFATELQWTPISKMIYWAHDPQLYPAGTGTNTIFEKTAKDATLYGFTETAVVNGVTQLVSMALFGGDCFLGVGFIRNYFSNFNRPTPDGQQYVDVGKLFSCVSENNNNPTFRQDYISDLTEQNYLINLTAGTMGTRQADRTFFPYYAGILNQKTTWWYYINRYKLLETNSYNKGFSVTDATYQITPFDPNTPLVKQRFFTRIWYSLRQDYSSTIDYYREFLPLDFQDFDIKYGQIIDLINYNGQLYMIQESAISKLTINDRVQVAADPAGPIFASSAGVLSQYVDIISDEVGSQHRFAQAKGKTGFFGVDVRKNLLWAVVNGVFNPISYLKNSTILFDNVIPYRTHQPLVGSIDIRIGVNKFNGDIYFTFYDQRSDAIAGNAFTFTYNELLKIFTGNKVFIPSMYFNINNDLYCFPPLRDNTGVLITQVPVWKFNSNNVPFVNFFGTQYGMEFEFILNKDVEGYQKILDNLQLITNNVYPDEIDYFIESASHTQSIYYEDDNLMKSNAKYREDKVWIECGKIDTLVNGTPSNEASIVDIYSRIRSKYIKVRVKYYLNNAKPQNTDVSKEVRVRAAIAFYRLSYS